MAISDYLKEIGRGRNGARALSREQAADLMGKILDGSVSDLEIGAFCAAMRIKGETPEEMAGFLDATHARLQRIAAPKDSTVVVLPTYNGARRLPVLTPLLASLLAREGVPVLMHGTATESARVTSEQVLNAMGIHATTSAPSVQSSKLTFVPTEVLCPGLKRLLDVRRVIGLRNSAHSLVKLMNPILGNALLISSYTHPEYALSMAATFELTNTRALLLRGTEGEVVADPRRTPQIDAFIQGQRIPLVEPHVGTLAQLPRLPEQIDANATAHYIQSVLDGSSPVPSPIAQQVRAVLQAIAM